MAIRPLGTRVAIKTIEEETTKSGIYLPDSAKEKKAEGTIIAVGIDPKIGELGLSVGLRVVYSKYSGGDVETEEGEVRVINCEDVLAIIE